ncbi:MAG: hypothetical protein RXQ70_00605 [Sulfolobaceae archaeon]|nr:DUF973 family protein [Sulfolobales archaeon]
MITPYPNRWKRSRYYKEMRETIRRALKDLNPEIRGLGNLTYGMYSITSFIAAVGFFAFILSLVVALSHSKSLPAEFRLIPTASSTQTLLAAYEQAFAFLQKNVVAHIVMIAILLACVLSLFHGVYRTYKGFSYLSRYVPHAGLGKAGAVLYLIPPLIPVGNILLGISLFFVGSKYKNARLKVGGIMTAIPFPLLGLVIEMPIGLLPLITFILLLATITGPSIAYNEGYSILKKYYSYVSYEKLGHIEPEAHSEVSVDFGWHDTGSDHGHHHGGGGGHDGGGDGGGGHGG